MNAYKHVLVAVDFAEKGRLILDRAIQLASANDARLTLLHVVEYSEFAYSGDLIGPEEVHVDRELAAQAEQRLEQLCKDVGLVEAAKIVELGAPKRVIVQIAEEHEVDLIVVGSHGRHGLQLLLGSTANGVLHLAHCDVLAVRVGSV